MRRIVLQTDDHLQRIAIGTFPDLPESEAAG